MNNNKAHSAISMNTNTSNTKKNNNNTHIDTTNHIAHADGVIHAIPNNKTDTNIASNNFIRTIIKDDLASGKYTAICTRFPPEPNGFLHIGHIKSICLNFGLAKEFGGTCNLRFDDTNPEKETLEYIKSIEEDVKWLGFFWHGNTRYASDYFAILYECAIYLIKAGLAYVCDLSSQEVANSRGNFTISGTNSPYRNRSVAENLTLFARMRAKEFADSSKTLRLKIDMTASNLNMRDPVIYRIKHLKHLRTGDDWCIYPMYDYTHCISDALEGITHSCCTLEFADHRPLYDWILDKLQPSGLINCHPQQIEFARLELKYTVTSKRKLIKLVNDHVVNGFTDPRMPTIAGMRKRGYRPSGLKLFIERCGVSKAPNIVDFALLETSIREDLEESSLRLMAVIRPLRVLLINYDEALVSGREIALNPNCQESQKRHLRIMPEIYIEQDDFKPQFENGFKRLILGGEVRLRHSYIIKCQSIQEDGTLCCTIDYDTLGKSPAGRKVKGVIHWVNAIDNTKAMFNIYDQLFTKEFPDKIEGHDFSEFVNTCSFTKITAYVEKYIETLLPLAVNNSAYRHYQFERLGYFVLDSFTNQHEKCQQENSATSDHAELEFNLTVTLKDNPIHITPVIARSVAPWQSLKHKKT